MSKPEEKSIEQRIQEASSKAAADAASAAASAVVKEMLPAVAAMMNSQKGGATADAPAPKVIKPTCPICKQKNLACGYKMAKADEKDEAPEEHHRRIAVYPRNARLGRWFQGVFFNGTRYLSNSQMHQIWVPKDSNIEYILEMWERNEDELSTGRVAEHDSGLLGPNGSNTNRAQSAWR